MRRACTFHSCKQLSKWLQFTINQRKLTGSTAAQM